MMVTLYCLIVKRMIMKKNKIIRYTEEFIFEKGSIKRITTYDNKTYIDILPEFDKDDLYRFIDEKVSEIRGNNIKR